MPSVEKFKILSDRRVETDEDLISLAASIKRNGLFNPITVRKDGDFFIIQAGRRRFRALTQVIGLKTLEEHKHYRINKEGKEDISDAVVQLLENIDRKNITPVEASIQVNDIHVAMQEEHGVALPGSEEGWGIKDTARILGKSQAYVSRMLAIYKNREELEEFDTLRGALEKVNRTKAHKIIKQATNEVVKKKLSGIDQENFVKKQIDNFKNADAIEFLKGIPSESIDIVLTDPPYGVGYDSLLESTIYEDVFDDSPETAFELLEKIVPEFYRVCTNSSYCIIWCSTASVFPLGNLLRECGFTVYGQPLIWVKLGNRGFSRCPSALVSGYETAVFATKGSPRVIDTTASNIILAEIIQGSNKIHPTQKPDLLMQKILSSLVKEGSTVLDCFAGSGSVLRACISENMIFKGCEISKDYYNSAIAATMELYNDKI